MDEVLITSIVTVGLAFSGYLITYFINIRTDQRKEKLDRVNRQLKELYGPMFALTQASNRAWKTFTYALEQRFPSNQPAIFSNDEDVDPEKMRLWILWVRTVFMPINEDLYATIINYSDLLIEEAMPTCILNFLAHVAAYKVVLKKWDEGDLSDYTSIINYPREIEEYSQSSYEQLKAE
ncbi:hypothetical protein G4Y79_18610 [Phototrophicus methaneseepsis]|uniref:DUF4760 domain-containing protein n=1 Tax=Phototrophicus methaneseepsis TaxID=2710758 RepID=A0A7S8E7E9_9CHLR|nr:hypothetical protein [Phototrophicus methaneseepsis]QPC81683.1 hypothetical protein G4Y79_18610 [Phototrophicus methaneseepsis]